MNIGDDSGAKGDRSMFSDHAARENQVDWPKNGPVPDGRAELRRGIYFVLIAVGLGAALGRILAVDAVDRTAIGADHMKRELAEAPEALKQQGLRGRRFDDALAAKKAEIEKRWNLRRPFLSANDRSRWDTVRALVEPEMCVPGAPFAIDRVIQERNYDTIDMVKHDGHFYSSKPTLLPVLMAAEYWVIYHVTGWSLATDPFLVGRIMLATINGGCLLVYFLAMASLVERLGTTDWGRIFVMAAAVFGTFLTTFVVVINNHLVGAACAAVVLDAGVRIWLDGERRLQWFALAGLAAGLLATDELPALALVAPLALAGLWKLPRQTLRGFLPPLLLLGAALLATNWIAHNSLRLPYAHRGPGDNWYDYPGSHWIHPAGVDHGEASVARYAFHVLVGHHGIFSLTPLWLMSVCGTLLWLRRGGPPLRLLAAGVAAVSLVCVAFYLFRPMVDRNYGGMNTGFRWVFWLAPLWLAVMLPSADAVSGRRPLRVLALLLLAASVVSAHYASWNPWSNPWIVDFMARFVG